MHAHTYIHSMYHYLNFNLSTQCYIRMYIQVYAIYVLTVYILFIILRQAEPVPDGELIFLYTSFESLNISLVQYY